MTTKKFTVEIVAGNEPGAFKKLKSFKYKEVSDKPASSKTALMDYRFVDSGRVPLSPFEKEQLQYQEMMDRMEDLLGSSSSSEDGRATSENEEECD